MGDHSLLCYAYSSVYWTRVNQKVKVTVSIGQINQSSIGQNLYWDLLASFVYSLTTHDVYILQVCAACLYGVCCMRPLIKRIIETRRVKRIDETNGCCRCSCCCIRFNATVASSLYISSTHVDDRSSGSDVSLLASMTCMRVYLCSVGEYMNWKVGDRSVMMRSC